MCIVWIGQILRLYKTFQTRDCLFMVLEFCQGGDMFTLLGRQGGRLESPVACYYAGIGAVPATHPTPPRLTCSSACAAFVALT